MLTLSVDTFLKILGKGSPQKVQEFNRLLASNGFPYYAPLKDGAYALTINDEQLAHRVSIIENATTGPRRQYNVAAIKSLAAWMKRNKPEAYFQPPVKVIATPAQFLSIRLKPEFGVVLNGARYLVHVWYAKEGGLPKNTVMLGNWLIEKYLCRGDEKFKDCKPCILDLRKRQLLNAQGDGLTMDLLITSEFAWIDNYFTALEAATMAAE